MDKFIIVGKAASGKDWLQKEMVKRGYVPMKQYTTREMRENETGNEYHFISQEEFEHMKEEGRFVSANFYRIGWYGISYDELINSDVAILSPANVNDIINAFPQIRDIFKIIYLDIPISIRRERLNSRYKNKIGDDNEVRIMNDEKDFMDFTTWDIRLDGVESINDFLTSVLP